MTTQVSTISVQAPSNQGFSGIVTESGGFNSAISYSCSVPTGVTCSVTGSATGYSGSVSASAAAAGNLTITATGGGITNALTVPISVTATPPPPVFFVNWPLTWVYTTPSHPVLYPVSITESNGWNAGILFTIDPHVSPGLSACLVAASGGCSPTSFVAPVFGTNQAGTITVALTPSYSALPGTYCALIYAQGTIGATSITEANEMCVSVAATVPNDFQLTVAPSVNVPAGGSGQIPVTVAGQGTFTGPVNLTSSDPNVSFSTSPIPAPGTAMATYNAGSKGPGTYNLSISGNGIHPRPVTITVPSLPSPVLSQFTNFGGSSMSLSNDQAPISYTLPFTYGSAAQLFSTCSVPAPALFHITIQRVSFTPPSTSPNACGPGNNSHACQVTFTAKADTLAAAGKYPVTCKYTNTDGALGMNCAGETGVLCISAGELTVSDATPVITSISPSTVAPGAVNTISVHGHNFGTNPIVNINGMDYTPSSADSQTANVLFSVPGNAAVGSTIPVYVRSNGENGQGFMPRNSSAQSNTYNIAVGQGACTPTISSLQVNGAATNTIIAGTSGTISINGSCMTGTTGVGLPPGVNVSTFSVINDSTVNVVFTSQSNAPTGQNNVTVANQTGTSTSNAPAVTVAITLKSFSFADSLEYSRDCIGGASLITAPTWPSPTGTTVTCPQSGGYTGDHAIYSAGDTMAGTATFTVTPPPTQAVPGVYIQGTTSSSGTFSVSGFTIPAGQPTFPVDVIDGTDLPASRTQFLNPMSINWSVTQSGTSCNDSTHPCVAAGASANPVYVTLADDILPTSTAMLTYVALAVGNGGATDPTTAFAKTWAQFSTSGTGPADVKTWSGTTLSYYPQGVGFQDCALNPEQLLTTSNQNGQCGSFAQLFQYALDMNGIATSFTSVGTANEDLMVVKNWNWPQNPTQSTLPYGWILALEGEPGIGGTAIGMVPLTPAQLYGDLTSLQGAPGQGENNPPAGGVPSGTPSEKVFGAHFIVKILDPILAPPSQAGPYFDPSYGFWYADAADFETKAIAGYARGGFTGDGPTVYRFQTVPVTVPPTTNITLNP
jgi:hypothetical protein